MAEDEDDEPFGDFAFAPFQSSSKSVAPNLSAEDDWSDFLSSPQQSNPSDPTVEENRAPDKSVSVPAWVKPRGALPLSIFGDAEEEEEEKGNSSVDWGFDQQSVGDFDSKLGSKDVPNSQNLKIADLYNRYPQFKPELQREANSTGFAFSVDSEAYLRSNQNVSESAVTESKSVDLNGNGGVEDQNRITDLDTSKNGDLFGSLTQGFYGVSSNFMTSSPSLQISNTELDIKGQKQQQGGSDDGGEDEWEFKDAHNEKVTNNEASNRSTHLFGNVIDPSKSHNVIRTSNGSVDFFFPSTESIDYFASSSVLSTGPMEVEFFGNQMGVTTLNSWTSDTKSNIEQTKTNSMFNHSSSVGNGEFDEDFGDFTAASDVTESRPREVSTTDVFASSKGAAPTPGDKIQVDFMVPDVSKRNVNSSGSVFGESNGSIDFFAPSAEPVDLYATSSIPNTNKEVDLFGFQSMALNGLSSSANSETEQIKVKDTPDHIPDFKAADEDFGEFTAAAAETGPKPGVGLMVDEAAERRADSFMSISGSKKSFELFEMSNGSTNFFGTSTESVDFFAPSSGISSTSQEVDLNGIQTSTETINGVTPEKVTNIEQNNVNGTLDHSPDVRDFEFDDFGEFTAAAAQTEPQTAEMDTKSNYHKRAIPLSLFGSDEPENQELQSGGSSDVQDMFKYQSNFDQRNSHTQAAVLSIDDLISSLYSQAEQAPSVNAIEEQTKTELNISNAVSYSSVKHLEHGMWDFNDASQTRVGSEGLLNSTGDDALLHVSSQLELNPYLDFYHKLKDELFFVIKRQIENLRHAGDDASLSGEGTRVASLENEFQLVCKELEQLKFPFEESNSQDHPSGESLKKIVEVLLEPQFQILESEYHLSNKLWLAEKDERLTVELIRHTTAMLKILTIGTLEERKAYIYIWYEMISVCARELKHGASIWNQAVEKQVQSHLLSEPQGKKYFLGLGEIYRVVAVLGASTELYKPWTFSGVTNLPSIYTLLDECHDIWSSSRLEEALSSVLLPTDTLSSLMSIKHILSLDALALQNHVLAKTESLCQLSLLTAAVVPGMKMVTWENQECFVALTNLWANMIARHPPQLPRLSIPSQHAETNGTSCAQ